MTLPRLILVFSFVIFLALGVAVLVKKSKKDPVVENKLKKAPIEIDISQAKMSVEVEKKAKPVLQAEISTVLTSDKKETLLVKEDNVSLPKANRMEEFFNLDSRKFPIVETITYRSKVAWLKGRPAWLSDYAGYYGTSRHFIARSLNKKPDYFKQDVVEGDRFNVFKKDRNVNFYLLVDLSRSKLWFYYIDLEKNQRVLVKDYVVGLGRPDPTRTSGHLTPLGKYALGNKIAIYKPKMTGFYNGQKVEMMRIFGTRWIPFSKEASDASAEAKGIGIHGVPWKANEKGALVEDISSLGKFQSDGCIRMATDDIEELFAVIITKPTTIEIVKDFRQAQLPGIEKQ